MAADGRQYVVISAGGHGGLGRSAGDDVMAYALPAGDRAALDRHAGTSIIRSTFVASALVVNEASASAATCEGRLGEPIDAHAGASVRHG